MRNPFPFVMTEKIKLGVVGALLILLGLTIYRGVGVVRKGGTARILPFTSAEADFYELDNVAGHVHRPNVERTIVWNEYPGGRFVSKTNNLGFREDQPTSWTKAAGTVRILVTGDSHIDGVVPNADSFPNLLERHLCAAAGAGRFEVINGGTGYYGPQNYAGFLKKYAGLRPDWFIVVVYTGNDYVGAVQRLVMDGSIHIPERQPEYLERLAKANSMSGGYVGQVLNQVAFFAAYPAMTQVASDATWGAFQDIKSECARDGISLLVILLPSSLELDYPTVRTAEVDALLRTLDLHEADLIRCQNLTDTLRAGLEGAGVRVLDLRPPMKGLGEELFWKLDHHLNQRGHALLEKVLWEAYGRQVTSAASVPLNTAHENRADMGR